MEPRNNIGYTIFIVTKKGIHHAEDKRSTASLSSKIQKEK